MAEDPTPNFTKEYTESMKKEDGHEVIEVYNSPKFTTDGSFAPPVLNGLLLSDEKIMRTEIFEKH